MSPAATLGRGRISGLSEKNSPQKLGSLLKRNKQDPEKLKNATFSGFGTKNPFTDIATQVENKGMSNTADLGALAMNSKIRRSYLSDGDMAKSFEIDVDGGDEEERKSQFSYDPNYSNSRGLQNFSGDPNLASSQRSNNEDKAISEDSMNQRHAVSGKGLNPLTCVISLF